MTPLAESLRASHWGRNLTDEEFERALAGTTERRIETGAFVCMKGEPVDHWLGVIDGLVKMSSDWVTGKTTTFTGLATGGWFGEGSLLKSDPRKYDVVALRDSRIAYLNRSTFLWLMDHSIPFNRFLITQLNERLGQFIGMMENERLLDTDARLARNLAAMFNPVLYPGTGSELLISQEGRNRLSRRPLTATRQSGTEETAGRRAAQARIRQGDHSRRGRAAPLRGVKKTAGARSRAGRITNEEVTSCCPQAEGSHGLRPRQAARPAQCRKRLR